jgi:hypothetical protein
MVEVCEEVEALARAGRLPPADDLLCRFEQEFDRVTNVRDAVVPRR